MEECIRNDLICLLGMANACSRMKSGFSRMTPLYLGLKSPLLLCRTEQCLVFNNVIEGGGNA